jgi:hypothetical protein
MIKFPLCCRPSWLQTAGWTTIRVFFATEKFSCIISCIIHSTPKFHLRIIFVILQLIMDGLPFFVYKLRFLTFNHSRFTGIFAFLPLHITNDIFNTPLFTPPLRDGRGTMHSCILHFCGRCILAYLRSPTNDCISLTKRPLSQNSNLQAIQQVL